MLSSRFGRPTGARACANWESSLRQISAINGVGHVDSRGTLLTVSPMSILNRKIVKYMGRRWVAAGGVLGRRTNPLVEARVAEVAARLELDPSVVEHALEDLRTQQVVQRLGRGAYSLTPPGVALAGRLP